MFKNTIFISVFTVYIITYLLIFSGMFVVYSEEDRATYENTFYETELVRDPDKGSYYDKSDIKYKENEYDLIDTLEGKKIGKYNLTVENKISEKTIKDESYFVPKVYDGKEVLELNEKLITGQYYREATDQYVENARKGNLFPKVIKEYEQTEFEIYGGNQKIEKDYYGNDYYLKDGAYRKLKQEQLITVNQKIEVYNWVRTNRSIEIEPREDYYDGEYKYLNTGKFKYNYAVQENIYRIADKPGRQRTMRVAQDAVAFELIENEDKEKIIIMRFITSNNTYVLDKVDFYESDITERGSDENRIESLFPEENAELSIDYETYYNIRFQNIYKFWRVSDEIRRLEKNLDEVKYEGDVVDFRPGNVDNLLLDKVIINSSNQDKIFSVFDEYVRSGTTVYEQNQILNYDNEELKYYGKLNPDGTYSDVSEKIKKEWLGWSKATPITEKFHDPEGYEIDIPYGYVEERSERESSVLVDVPAEMELSENPAEGYENVIFTLSDGINLEDMDTKTYLIELNDQELESGYQKTYFLKKNEPIVQKDILVRDGKLVVFNTHYIDGKNYEIIKEEKEDEFYRPSSWIQPRDEGQVKEGDNQGKVISYRTIETGITVNEYKELIRSVREDSNGNPLNVIKSKTKGVSKTLSIGQKVLLNGKEHSVTKENINMESRGARAYIHISSEIIKEEKAIDKSIVITIMFIGVGVAVGGAMLFMFKEK